MASVNARRSFSHIQTAGGVPAYPHVSPEQQLRRLCLSSLLWEDQFYVDGKTIADQIKEAADKVSPSVLASIAVDARTKYNLRHLPLYLCTLLAKRGGPVVSETIVSCIQRADELAEFLSLYWKNGKTPISKQVKKGLASAFKKFDEYALAKYDRAKAVRLRDVMFLTHPKPDNDRQADLWKRLTNNDLQTPDTWEVSLSSGADKKETFERLIREGKLGYLALLRNLRNMVDAGCDLGLVSAAIEARKGGADKVLPFRYIAAARAAPRLEPAIDRALLSSIESLPKLQGHTVVLVDVSGSMNDKLSSKSDLTRADAAAALASILNCDSLQVITFSNHLVECPPRRGMAGVDTILKSQPRSATYLAQAVDTINKQRPCDRLIVITDEQATDGRVPDPAQKHAYMINVGSNKNGVGYGKWVHIDGFSEQVIRFIHEYEAGRE